MGGGDRVADFRSFRRTPLTLVTIFLVFEVRVSRDARPVAIKRLGFAGHSFGRALGWLRRFRHAQIN